MAIAPVELAVWRVYCDPYQLQGRKEASYGLFILILAEVDAQLLAMRSSKVWIYMVLSPIW